VNTGCIPGRKILKPIKEETWALLAQWLQLKNTNGKYSILKGIETLAKRLA
jgi:hypothetical protein